MTTGSDRDEIVSILRKFAVPESEIKVIIEKCDRCIIREAVEWILRLTPGFRKLPIMEGIAIQVERQDHTNNVNYLKRNSSCIPQLPSNVLDQELIVPFFTLVRDLLGHEIKAKPSPPNLPS